MEPIGTITNYFPFLEEDTVHVLKDVMDQASNYYDFVVRLGNKACDEDVSLELVYMAAVNVSRIKERNILECLKDKYTDRPEIIIWTFPLLGDSDRTEYRDEYQEVRSKVTKLRLPDWFLIEIHLSLDDWFARTSAETSELIEKIESILNRNNDLDWYKTALISMESWVHNMNGDSITSILMLQKGLELAEKYDDIYGVMASNWQLANSLRNHNAQKALEYVEEHNRIAVFLGLPRSMELARHLMGVIHLTRGEYDMALECNFAAIEVYYHNTRPSSTMCGVISTIYNDIEDRTQALHWANEGFRAAGGKGSPILHAAKSIALLLLGRLEDAEHHLDELHKLSLESAAEEDQALLLYGRGFYELKSGNPQAAIDSLEQALSINEQLNTQIAINRCLIALTQAEIQLASESGTQDCSGPWMVRLETHARKKDYPGIQMQAALLRAEFLMKQGRKVEAQQVLRDALDILDSPTVKTLRTKIEKMLDDLIIA